MCARPQREGGVAAVRNLHVADAVSIHAPTRGTTSFPATCSRYLARFNPRPHERGDLVEEHKAKREKVSIHAPTRGATSRSSPFLRRYASFNPRPHERGDTARKVVDHELRVFQSTPPREGRLGYTYTDESVVVFQSTPPREGRLGVLHAAIHSASPVSIHAPTRGATLIVITAI